MNGQPIPGMYWDPEKKKYFRIQTGVAARESNWKHSIHNVRKEDERDRFKKKTAVRTRKILQERVVRKHVGALLQAEIDRELGLRRPSFYRHQLWPAACLAVMHSEPSIAVDGFDRIRCFDYDPASKTIYAVQGDKSVCTTRTVECPADELSQLSYFPFFTGRDRQIMYTDSTVSSLNYLPSTGAMAVTTYGSARPPVVSFYDLERSSGQEFKAPAKCRTIWGAAARPASFLPSQGLTNSVAATVTEHLAVAASKAMLLYTRSPTGTWDFESRVKSAGSDILAVDWLSYSTVAFGCRDGSVFLDDTRADGFTKVLTHPYPISKVKLADDPTRLIVSGLEDSLFLYDIRSARLTSSSAIKANRSNNNHYNEEYFQNLYPRERDAGKRRRLNYEARSTWSQPVLSFLQRNPKDLELDIAVHPRLGLLAASQDPGNSFGVGIRVSNIWTGKTVKEIDAKPNVVEWKDPEKIRSLKFVDDEDGKDGVELWSCWGGEIVRFT